MKQTQQCLHEMIAGEMNATASYTESAHIALREDFPNVAYLFFALACAEEIHANNARRLLEGDFSPEKAGTSPGPTQANLAAALRSETEEFKKWYPRLIRRLKPELAQSTTRAARLAMIWARDAEKQHARLLKAALKSLEKGQDFDLDRIYLCEACGNLELRSEDPKDACKVCGHDPRFFRCVERETLVRPVQ